MFKIKAPDGSNNLCGRNIASIRKSMNMSQRALARKLQVYGYDVDHHFVRRIENGERFVTDIELVILSNALNTDLESIIKGSWFV